jgi:hypothetical protein
MVRVRDSVRIRVRIKVRVTIRVRIRFRVNVRVRDRVRARVRVRVRGTHGFGFFESSEDFSRTCGANVQYAVYLAAITYHINL